MTQRTILHLDLDAFYCAVEEQRDPALKGISFAVGGRPDQRGVVSSCSYAARRFGIHSAMPMSRALALCPDLVIVSPHFTEYHRASQQVMERLRAVTPVVEQISIDEAFMEVTGLRISGEALARDLQRNINHELRLPCSFGVASSKLVAKIANNIGKASAGGDGPPNAIKVISPGQEAAFLAPLPIRELWGVGPKSAEKLARIGVTTIGDLARQPEKRLAELFGKNGAEMARHARGSDDRPLETDRETKSISKEITFAHDISDGEHLRRTLRRLCEGVGFRLRKEHLRGSTVRLKLRWSDFTTLTRQVTLPQPTDHDQIIIDAALELFRQNWPVGRPVRLIGAGVSGFDDETPGQQLGLWETRPAAAPPENDKLQAALDKLRDRFGEDIIQRGSDLEDEDA